MILAKTGSVFAAAGRRHGQDTGYSTPLHVTGEGRGKGLSSRQKGFLPAEIMWQSELCSYVYCQRGRGVSV